MSVSYNIGSIILLFASVKDLIYHLKMVRIHICFISLYFSMLFFLCKLFTERCYVAFACKIVDALREIDIQMSYLSPKKNNHSLSNYECIESLTFIIEYEL